MTTLLSIPFLASAAGAAETAAQDHTPVPLQAAILLVLLLVLGFMGIRLVELGRAVRALEERLAAGPARRPEAGVAPVPAPAGHGISEELLVVISAAVVAAYGHSARVVSVGDDSGTIRPWSLEGRRQIFASHAVR